MDRGSVIALIVSFTLALGVVLIPPRGAEGEIRAAVRAQRRDPMVAVALWDRAIRSTPWQEQIQARRQFLNQELGLRQALPSPPLRELYDEVWDIGEGIFEAIENHLQQQ